ncbi:hydroxyacid dehydrogenase [Terrarubrum flagellatum]|uniref:hydroxyacid dehydrogenase n=1 Tax=Terrirubrum flagellatum TaxID=2895980 RepID=UPI0031455252
MPDIVVAEFMDEEAVSKGLAGHDVFYDPKLVDRPDDLARLVADARALIVRNRTQVRGALLDAAPKLKVVGRLGVGLDNIDVEACKARGIKVFPATGANDLSVAEYVISAAMILLRGAYHATSRVIAGEWPRNALMGRELSGKVMGLVGFGAIAREVARRAQALGMQAIAFDPYAPDAAFAAADVKRHGLEPLLREADVVSLHVPLDDGTRNMIDALRLQRMKPGSILINAARGGVVDEAAVVAALRSGHLGGAALDVFAEEPLTAEKAKLFDGAPNLILTPHIAGVTQESNVRVSWVTVENVKKALGA